MKKSVLTWGVLLALIIFSGLTTAVLSQLGQSGSGGGGGMLGNLNLDTGFEMPTIDTSVETITIHPSLPFIGEKEVSELAAFGILAAIIGGAIVAMGIPLAITTLILDKVTNGVLADDEYRSGRVAMDQTAKEEVKRRLQEQPPTPMPSHERHGWTAASTIMIMMLVMAFTGMAFSENFLDGNNVYWWAFGFAMSALALGLLVFNGKQMKESAESSGNPIDWGKVWTFVSGLVVVGVGLGVMMWVRSQGGG